MKKFIAIIFKVLLIATLSGCGTAKNLTLTSYVERGTGVAMNEDMAFKKAIHSALTKISNEYSVTVDDVERQLYTSNERNHGRNNENLVFETNSTTKSSATINRYRVVKRRFHKRWFRTEYTCRVKVAVDFDNVN